jgi:two-component system OmpR family sensor kinase
VSLPSRAGPTAASGRRSPIDGAEGSSTRALKRLRRRMTAIYGTVATIGLVTLATLTLVTDARTRDLSFDAELRGLAITAGRLVVVQGGRLVTSGLTGDMVNERIDAVQVVQPGDPPVSTRVRGEVDGEELGRQQWTDASEQGSDVVEIVLDGHRAKMTAMPFFSDDNGSVAGAVVVAKIVPAEVDEARRRLVLVVGLTAGGLVSLSLVTGWVYAGRQARRIGGVLDQQEAFLTLAAHELRTPIGRMRAVAESARLIVRDSRHQPVSRQALVAELDRLVAIAQDASANVDDLLLLGRIGADRHGHRLVPVRLDELVGTFEDIVPNTVVHTPGPVTVPADDALLRHLVHNLVGNARRHGTGEDGRPPRIDVALVRRFGADGSGHVVLTVSDDGPGFAPEVLGTAFERFVGGGRGTGLGLWIVRWIAELHGGTAVAANLSLGGAVVTVTLPATGQRGAGVAPGPRATAPTPR